MARALSCDEIDELLHYTRIECDFAESSVLGAATDTDRCLSMERYANARYLVDRLEVLLGDQGYARNRYLLAGAERWGRKFVANMPPAPVVSMAAFRRHRQL